ncbi:MAG: ATP-binding protein [Spirochaetaceae bacterium]|jgi:ABC-type cobalamin/Fe3+-siderophores transport system ATPase subunit|nr:ATP-binding protein [Spirochaetaceae bacterium]
MLFKINNIGKIQEAEIEVNGITVIAGHNNTGKSTYGKILYCMFNAFCDAQAAIHRERRKNIKDFVHAVTRFRYGNIRAEDLIQVIINDIIDHQSSKEEIRTLLEGAIDDKIPIVDKTKDAAIDFLVEKIVRAGEVTDEQIQRIILTRFLRSEFGNQINHVNHAEETGIVSLTIDGKTLSASIKNNECTDFSDNAGIINNVLYIDTPFILDENEYGYFLIEEYGHRQHLRESLSQSSDGMSAVDEILAKQRLQRILLNIRNVINGEFQQVEGDWMFQENGLNEPLGMFSLSTGMKPFLIIKRLMEAGEIKEHSVLVFDEPEIHLHPEWQLKYAELLVLLQKEYNLTILLTTHSPYFLNAIEVYSKKNNISARCNYYLTDTQGDIGTIEDVTENIDLVYQKLARPFQELENLRYKED